MSMASETVGRDPRQPWLLAGAGAGEALAEHIATQRRQQPETAVFAFRVGRHRRGHDADRLAYRLLLWLRSMAAPGEPLPTRPEAVAELLPNWLARAASARPLLIAIAEPERLLDADGPALPDWLLAWRPPRVSLLLASGDAGFTERWAAAGGRVVAVDAGQEPVAPWPEAPPLLEPGDATVLDEAWALAGAGRTEALRDWLCRPEHLHALLAPPARVDLHRWLRELAPALGGGAGVLAPLDAAIAALPEPSARADAWRDAATLVQAIDPDADALPLLERALQALPDDPACVLAISARENEAGRHERAATRLDPLLAGLPADHPLAASLRHQRAVAAESVGDLATAERLYQQNLKLREDAEGPHSATLLPHLANLAGVLQARQDPQAAKPWRQRAADIAVRVHGKADPRTAAALDALAGIHYGLGDPAAAGKQYRESLAVLEAAFGPDHPATAAGLHNLATALDAQSDYAQAEAMHRRALAIREKRLGRVHEDTAASRHNLASVLDESGRKEGAEVLYREAIADWQALVGDDHPATATSRNNLADLLAERGDHAGAESLYRANLRTFAQRYGEQHPHTLLTTTELGATLCALGRRAEGEALLRSAIEQTATVVGETSLSHVDAVCKLGVALKQAGRLDEARALLDAAIARLEPKLGVISPRLLRLQRHREAIDRDGDDTAGSGGAATLH